MIRQKSDIPLQFRRFLKRSAISKDDYFSKSKNAQVKHLLNAFSGVPTIIMDERLKKHLNPYARLVGRVYPNPEFFLKRYRGRSRFRMLEPPKDLFPMTPRLSLKLFSSELGSTFAWLALNPWLTGNDLAELTGRPYHSIQLEIGKLVKAGLLRKVTHWCVHPELQGPDNLFQTEPNDCDCL